MEKLRPLFWKVFLEILLLTLVFSKDTGKCSNTNLPNNKGKEDCGCSKLKRETVREPLSLKDSIGHASEKPSQKYLQESQSKAEIHAKTEDYVPNKRTNQMVFIEGGTFTMGTNKPYLPRDGEGPARPVRLKSFFADIYEVSNAEFGLFVKSTGHVTEVSVFL